MRPGGERGRGGWTTRVRRASASVARPQRLARLAALLVLACGGAATAGTPLPALDGAPLSGAATLLEGADGVTLQAPRVVGGPVTTARKATRLPDPAWTRHGLWALPPTPTRESGDVPVSQAVYDPSSDAWFAVTAGVLVRLGPDGAQTAFLDDVQGRDFDVRARERVVVWREQGDRIVLARLGDGGRAASRTGDRTVLLDGQRFFGPRLSPAGDAVLVSERRPGGGHVWVVDLDSGAARDLGVGHGPAWHPDGRHVLFARIEHDGRHVTGADLYVRALDEAAPVRLTATPDRAEMEPAVSPDGRLVGFVDGRTGDLLVGALPKAWRGGAE